MCAHCKVRVCTRVCLFMFGSEHVLARVHLPRLGAVRGVCDWLWLRAQIQSCRPLSCGPGKAEQAPSMAPAA